MIRSFVLCCTAFLLTVALGRAGDKSQDPIVAEALSRKTYVLAEFVSESCPACDQMAPVLDDVLARFPDVSHQVHDADLKVDLAKKYEVRCVPVYVLVDPDGNIHFNEVGMLDRGELGDILGKAGAAVQ